MHLKDRIPVLAMINAVVLSGLYEFFIANEGGGIAYEEMVLCCFFCIFFVRWCG